MSANDPKRTSASHGRFIFVPHEVPGPVRCGAYGTPAVALFGAVTCLRAFNGGPMIAKFTICSPSTRQLPSFNLCQNPRRRRARSLRGALSQFVVVLGYKKHQGLGSRAFDASCCGPYFLGAV